jgi:hypothetical protein
MIQNSNQYKIVTVCASVFHKFFNLKKKKCTANFIVYMIIIILWIANAINGVLKSEDYSLNLKFSIHNQDNFYKLIWELIHFCVN